MNTSQSKPSKRLVELNRATKTEGETMATPPNDKAMLMDQFNSRINQLQSDGYILLDYSIEDDGKVIVGVFQYGMFKIRMHLALSD